MAADEMGWLDAGELTVLVEGARGSRDELGAIFEEAARCVGRSRASRLWWQVFGAQDAAET